MHHVAYEVDDLRRGSPTCRAGRARDRRGAARGLFGMQVAFVHPESVHGVLAELVTVAERSDPDRDRLRRRQVMSAHVQTSAPTSSSSRWTARIGGTVQIEAEDGRYTIALARIVYVKRYSREGRVGFSGG
jgi:hypothetical protein